MEESKCFPQLQSSMERVFAKWESKERRREEDEAIADEVVEFLKTKELPVGRAQEVLMIATERVLDQVLG